MVHDERNYPHGDHVSTEAYYVARSRAVIARRDQLASTAAARQPEPAPYPQPYDMASAGAAASLANASYAPRSRERSQAPYRTGKVGINGLEESALAGHDNLNTLTSTAAHMASKEQDSRTMGFGDGTDMMPVGRRVTGVTALEPDEAPERDPLSVQAAYLALRDQSPSRKSVGDRSEVSPTGRRSLARDGLPERGAMRAANEALLIGRKRAGSAPPVSTRDLSYARTAATYSQRAAQFNKPVIEEERQINFNPRTIHKVAYENAQRDLYKDRPPVNTEAEERKRQQLLQTVTARVTQQRPLEDSAAVGSLTAGGVPRIDEYSTLRPLRLNAAATRLASEDLAKVYGDQGYLMDYYEASLPPRRRPSIIGKMRRRSSSEADTGIMDQEHSYQIRTEMTELQRRVSNIDNQRRRQDAAELEFRARRNAGAAIDEIDEDLYMYTGKPSQSMIEAWEEQLPEDRKISREVAAAGLVPIGGGRFMKQEEVDNIARSRVQPEINEIGNYWEEEHARDVEDHLDEVHRQHMDDLERERSADLDAEKARVKKEEKGKKYRNKSENGGSLFKYRSRKSKGKLRANDTDLSERNQANSGVTRREDDIHDLSGVKENEHTPPRSHVMHQRAGESSRSVLATSNQNAQNGSTEQAGQTVQNDQNGGQLGPQRSRDSQGALSTLSQRRKSWLKDKGQQPEGQQTGATASGAGAATSTGAGAGGTEGAGTTTEIGGTETARNEAQHAPPSAQLGTSNGNETSAAAERQPHEVKRKRLSRSGSSKHRFSLRELFGRASSPGRNQPSSGALEPQRAENPARQQVQSTHQAQSQAAPSRFSSATGRDSRFHENL